MAHLAAIEIFEIHCKRVMRVLNGFCCLASFFLQTNTLEKITKQVTMSTGSNQNDVTYVLYDTKGGVENP